MTVTAEKEGPVRSARACLDAARDALVAMRHASGYWKGELETNVTMDAEDLLLRQFLGIRTEEETAAAATWIRANQRDDGTWANFFGGPPELSTTVEAYLALRLAGDSPDEPHMRRAAAFILTSGGIEATRVFTRIWLALFGLWPWEDLPVLPPELIFLPRWCPLNIYDFACWARQTVVALTVVSHYRPVRDLGVRIDELFTGRRIVATPPLSTWAGRLTLLDRLLHRYERRPLRFLRRAALAKAERWIVEHQENDGGWGGIQPPWVYSMMALQLRGYSLGHPVLRGALAGLDAFTITDDAGRRLEACQSPVWDTVLAIIALADAGLKPDDPVLETAARWVVDEEITRRGDWAVRRPNLEPGGWAFEFENDWYPDIDDTAEVVLALARTEVADDPSLERGVAWVLGMQCADGGWGAFDVDNTRTLCREHPFCDFGELIDPPSADVTAHVVEMLATIGRAPEATRRGVEWLLAAQEDDGSWYGRWGANHVYGTGAAMVALDRGRCRPRRPGDRAVGRLAGGAPERRRRLGRGPPLLRRPFLARPRDLDGVADRMGAAGSGGGERARRGGPRRAVPRRHPARGRHLGRAVVHRHRLPRRLLHQLPPLPDGLPGLGPRPLCGAGGGLWLSSES